MKIIFFILFVSFFVSPVFAGGKAGVPTTLKEVVIIEPPPPPPEEEEVCEGDGASVPAPIIHSSYYPVGNIGFGMMSCDGLFMGLPSSSYVATQTVGSGVRHCVKKRR